MKRHPVGNHLEIKPSGRDTFSILETVIGLKTRKKKKKILSKAFKNNDQVVDDWTVEKAENPATK